MNDVRAALYARVSSEQQANAQTIAGQISALRERLDAEGIELAEELTFVDDGYSGATLLRPAMERLRDAAAAGAFERLYVQDPDRLARKYAYQVLLVDELKRAGVEIVFLNRALAQTPEDELLLQVQGMVAEYERAKILERGRRGKRQAAKAGAVSVLGGAPYGYRYVRKADGGGQARYEIAFEEARVVRRVFEWIGLERLSMAEVGRRLAAAGISTPTGKARWDRSTIWRMLKNPAYAGRAAFGRTKLGPHRPRLRAQRGHPQESRRPGTPHAVPLEEWIEIPVPPLVSPELFAAVQEQLEENRRRAKRDRRGTGFLVQGLSVCSLCGYAYCGARSGPRRTGGDRRRYGYYRCTGTDRFRFGGRAVCDNPATRGDLLDEAVWQEVRALLEDPSRLSSEYERRLDDSRRKESRDDREVLEGQIRRLRGGIGRLIDGYAEGWIEKAEFEPRVRRLKERITVLEAQLREAAENEERQNDLRLLIGQLEDFAGSVRANLDRLEWGKRREIVRALVKRVEIDHERVTVVFRVGPGPVVLEPEQQSVSQDRSGRGRCCPS
jgi:site-specific DNA recombinase